MNSEEHRRGSARRDTPGFGRRFLVALLAGADEALKNARAGEREREAEDAQCRLRPDHSRLTRGYREI